MNEMHIVYVSSGEYDDYRERNMFVTHDKSKAEKWVLRYNKIVADNYNRIQNYYDDENYEKPEPFCYDDIHWDKPTAHCKTIEVR